MSPPDLAIVGGGPAGLATGILAAQAGLASVVFDFRTLPVDKACGEGLMPSGAALLEAMGVRLPASACSRFDGIRYVDGVRTAEALFPSRPGIAARRTVLHQAMLDRARQVGVEVICGAPFRGFLQDAAGITVRAGDREVRARVLVGADGLGSAIRRAIGAERPPGRRARIGLRRHFEVAEEALFVEVHWIDGAEAYLTPVGGRSLGVALLSEDTHARFDELLARFTVLSARLAGARPLSPVRGAGPFCRIAARRVQGRVVLVGDAAGFIDPVAGDGITSAFLAARALVDLIAAGRPLHSYERDWRRATRRLFLFSRLLLFISRHPSFRRELMILLTRRPQLFGHLLAAAAGERRWPELGKVLIRDCFFPTR